MGIRMGIFVTLLCPFLHLWLSSNVEGIMATTVVTWSDDVIGCYAGFVVIEEAHYTNPDPNVCDTSCRLGPEGKGRNCYFSGSSCLLEATPQEVNAIYGACRPSAAPKKCNLTHASLPASLTVGYSCITGNIFDPYKKTFVWKSNEFTFAVGYNQTFPVTSNSITKCTIKSDSTQPNIKVSYLKSPVTETGNTSDVVDSDDVRFDFHGDTWQVEESYYPQWRNMSENKIEIVFNVKATSARTRPFWVTFQDTDSRMEVTCISLYTTPATTVVVKTTKEVTSSTTPMTEKPPSAFSLQDVVVAASVAAAVVTFLAVGIWCLLCRRKRRGQIDPKHNYEHILRQPSVQFSNRGDDSYLVTSLDSASSQISNRGLPPPPCADRQHRQLCDSNRLPPGSCLSNGGYAAMGCTQPKTVDSESDYVTPTLPGASAAEKTTCGGHLTVDVTGRADSHVTGRKSDGGMAGCAPENENEYSEIGVAACGD